MDVQLLSAIDAEQLSSLATLQRAAEAFDGHPALSEPQRAALTHLDLGGDGLQVMLASEDGTLVGCVVIDPQADGSHVLQVVVDPSRRDGLRGDLLRAALDAVSGVVRLWVNQADASSDLDVAAYGFVPERDVLQMRVALPLPVALTSMLEPLPTRAFVPGVDDAEWLALNNRAFAGHPEQGGWTESTLQERIHLDWFNADGFRVATDESGKMVGSCWTKIHHTEPATGEIYVIAVDPDQHGHHLGQRLAVAGLGWLADQGITHGMLYTGADNEVAVHLYRKLGFSDDHVDRCYVTHSQPG